MYDVVRAVNDRTGVPIAQHTLVARSWWRKVLGLHLLPRLQPGEGLLLPGATTIDTTFMRYPIDLVFLDRFGRVTRVVPNVAPWRMVLRTHGGRDCLELPAGAADAAGTQLGDLVRMSPLEGRAGR